MLAWIIFTKISIANLPLVYIFIFKIYNISQVSVRNIMAKFFILPIPVRKRETARLRAQTRFRKQFIKMGSLTEAEFYTLGKLYWLFKRGPLKTYSYKYLKTQPKTVDSLAAKRLVKLSGENNHLVKLLPLGIARYELDYWKIPLQDLIDYDVFYHTRHDNVLEAKRIMEEKILLRDKMREAKEQELAVKEATPKKESPHHPLDPDE